MMRTANDGFSMIEVLIVMVIFGIIVAFAAPKIDPNRYRVNASMQVLGTTMLTAQRQAVTQQHNIIVRFDTTSGRIRIHEDRNNSSTVDVGEHERAVPLGEGIVFGLGGAPQMAMGAGPVTFVRSISSLPAVVFHRDGSASEVGGFYVTSLRAQRSNANPDDARAVSIERATGRTSWFRYRSDGWVKVF